MKRHIMLSVFCIDLYPHTHHRSCIFYSPFRLVHHHFIFYNTILTSVIISMSGTWLYVSVLAACIYVSISVASMYMNICTWQATLCYKIIIFKLIDIYTQSAFNIIDVMLYLIHNQTNLAPIETYIHIQYTFTSSSLHIRTRSHTRSHTHTSMCVRPVSNVTLHWLHWFSCCVLLS